MTFNIKLNMFFLIAFLCFSKQINAQCAGYYTVQPGDTFYLISLKTGVDLKTLINDNGNRDPSSLRPYETLCIRRVYQPTQASTPLFTTISSTAQQNQTSPIIVCVSYQIKSGDTCYALSGGASQILIERNQGIDCNNLKVGSYICLPNIFLKNTLCSRTYNIVAGDWCINIANKLGLSLNSLISCNQGLDCNKLSVGQVLNY